MFLQFSTATEKYLQSVEYYFSIGHNVYAQNVWSWLHKSTLNSMDISPRKISRTKPGSLVCLPKLLQEYPLWSTYPSLQSKMKKENCVIWLFVFSVMVRSLPPPKKISLHISKNSLSLQFYTLSEKNIYIQVKYCFSKRQNFIPRIAAC